MLLLCVLPELQSSSTTMLFCTVCVLSVSRGCTCVCVCVCWSWCLCSLRVFQPHLVTPREAAGLQGGAVVEVPGWDASVEPHTMPDLLCAALLFNWNGIGLPRRGEHGAEELPHKSVFRSASANFELSCSPSSSSCQEVERLRHLHNSEDWAFPLSI